METLDVRQLSRRSLLGGGAALLTLPIIPGLGAAAVPESGVTRFVVDRNGSRFGSHVLRFRREGEDLQVQIEIDFKVGLGPITFFRYVHRNREVWRGDRLVSLESTTNDDGDDYWVSARAEGDKLLVDGSAGQLELPGDTLSTSYWHERTIDRRAWLDSQKGRLAESAVSQLGKESIEAGGETIEAERYSLRGDISCDLWYHRERWVKLLFVVDDSEIDYRLQGPLKATG